MFVRIKNRKYKVSHFISKRNGNHIKKTSIKPLIKLAHESFQYLEIFYKFHIKCKYNKTNNEYKLKLAINNL